MERSERWMRQAITDRKGTFRGFEMGMPLGEALELEPGQRERLHDGVRIRQDIEADAWSEVEIRFARLKGLDRVVGLRYTLATRSGFPDAEGCFHRLADHFTHAFGPPAPAATTGRTAPRLWKAQGRELPTTLRLELHDNLDEDRVRTASVRVVVERG